MRRPAVIAALLLFGGLSASACAQTMSMDAMPSMDLALGPSLNAGLSEGHVSEVVTPMGHLSDPFNTFYQTFSSRDGGPWTFSTPQGAGTNGGIVLANPANGAIAIRQFDQSHVSALNAVLNGTQVVMGGRILPALAQSPSALASYGNTVFFVTATGDLEVLPAAAQQARTVVTENQLAATPAGRTCGLEAVTAVAVNAQGVVAVGGRCGTSETAAIFVSLHGTWKGTALGGSLPNAVMRLDASGTGFTALVRTAGVSPSLRAVTIEVSGNGATSGLASPRIGLMYGVLRSSTPDEHGGYDVLVANSSTAAVSDLRPGVSVISLGRSLPLSAESIVMQALGGNQVAEVVEVHGGTATFAVVGTHGMWRSIQNIKVSIPYGSA